MKRYFVFTVLILVFAFNSAQTQIHEKEPEKSFIELRIDDIRHRIEIVEKNLQKTHEKIKIIREYNIEDEEQMIMIDALERAKQSFEEELQHVELDLEWRNTLPEKFRNELNKLEMKIHHLWEEGNEKEAQKHEIELDELLKKLHREFDGPDSMFKQQPIYELQISEEYIWGCISEEIKEKINAHREAAEKLEIAGYIDLANDMREKAQLIFEEAKKEVLKQMRIQPLEETRGADLFFKWWMKLTDEQHEIVSALKRDLIYFAINNDKDRMNVIADKLHEFYRITRDQGKKLDHLAELKAKSVELKCIKDEKEAKLKELNTTLEKAKADDNKGLISFIEANVQRLALEIEDIEFQLLDLNVEIEYVVKSETISKKLEEFREYSKKLSGSIDFYVEKLKKVKEAGDEKAIAETEKALSEFIKLLKDTGAKIESLEKQLQKENENLDKALEQTKLKRLTAHKSTLEKRITDLKDRLDHMLDGINKREIKDEITKLENALADVESKIKEMSR